MSATRHFAPATRRHRAQSPRYLRHAPNRRLLCEFLEYRLLLSGDSWVLPVDVPTFNQRHSALDDDGNSYVAILRDDGPDSDIWLGKFDPAGLPLWTKDLRQANRQNVRNLAVGQDGVYIVGSFGVSVDFDLDDPAKGELYSQGEGDGYLAKFSLDGGLIWARQWGGTGGGDGVYGVTVADVAVFITGDIDVPLSKTSWQTHMLVARLTSDGELAWSEQFADMYGRTIQVFAPSASPARVYVGGGAYLERAENAFLAKLVESVEGTSASMEWSHAFGIDSSGYSARLAVGTQEIDDTTVPSVYVAIQNDASLSAELAKFTDQGVNEWSKSMSGSAQFWLNEIAFESGVIYAAGRFAGEAAFSENAANSTVTSRGGYDAFLTRYAAADNGRLLAVQRMGGSGDDSWGDIAIRNGYVCAAGYSMSTNGDFPAGVPAELSAFVPGGNCPWQLFVMHLDAAAPIVQMLETDISVAPGASVPLTATTGPGSRIAWYDKNGNCLTDPALDTPTFTPALTQLVNQFSAVATDADGRIGMAGVVVTVVAPTKFYVVDDATANQTFEYSAGGAFNESYSLDTGNTSPRGAASTAAGDKAWVVDANRNVYVYSTSGGLPTSWTAGTLNSKSVVEGIATDGTDVWIVDAKTDKVYKYTGAASRTSGTQNAASSFSLNSGNISPKDIVTDGTYLWVVNDSTTDKVFKYTVGGTYVSSWTITTSGATSPTGITIDPSNVSDIWIVDSWTDRVYQYNAAVNFANASSHAADVSFALAPGNADPQGIADPPAAGRVLTTEISAVSPAATGSGTDGAPVSLYYVPLTQTSSALRVRGNSLRIDTARLRDARVVDSWVAGGESASLEPTVRLADDSRWARDNHRKTEVDDLFAQWESDPLELLSFPDLGM